MQPCRPSWVTLPVKCLTICFTICLTHMGLSGGLFFFFLLLVGNLSDDQASPLKTHMQWKPCDMLKDPIVWSIINASHNLVQTQEFQVEAFNVLLTRSQCLLNAWQRACVWRALSDSRPSGLPALKDLSCPQKMCPMPTAHPSKVKCPMCGRSAAPACHNIGPDGLHSPTCTVSPPPVSVFQVTFLNNSPNLN